MKLYSPQKPLLSIHVPKCGGTSFMDVLRTWYGGSLYWHYFDEKNNTLPEKIKLKPWYKKSTRPDICIHGHFNRKRGFGVDDYYPKVDQAILFLRDPLEIALSVFFFNHRLIEEGNNYRDGKKFEMIEDIDEYLESANSYITNFLPTGMTINTLDDYIDNYFVHIGVMESYQSSLNILAEKLGKPRIKISHKNRSERTQTPSEAAIKRFKNRCKLEYILYEKALKLNA